jgi:toxin ParE1/3/4
MANKVRLRQQAQDDLDALATYSLESFGAAQAVRYKSNFLKALDLLGVFPQMGPETDIREGLRRHVHASHAIYYRVDDEGIVVTRILGPGQDPTREFGD